MHGCLLLLIVARCRYLVGCDGVRSTVRDLMGVSTESKRTLAYLHSVHFFAGVDVQSVVGPKPAFMNILTNDEHHGDIIFAEESEGEGNWTLIRRAPPTPEAPKALDATKATVEIREIFQNPDLPVEVLRTGVWEMALFNADK